MAYTVGGRRSTTTGIFNLPQQWKQLGSSPSALILYGSWRQTPARTTLWIIRLLNLISLNHMTELDF